MSYKQAASSDHIRIVTSQSGRSMRLWKIMSWVTLSCINMSIAEQKGRGKFRWGFASLLGGGPFVTMFLTFSGSHAELPGELVPRADAIKYASSGEQPTPAALYHRTPGQGLDLSVGDAPKLPVSKSMEGGDQE